MNIPEKQVKRATYDRNVRTGKWREISPPRTGPAVIAVDRKTRGVHNYAGRTWFVWITDQEAT
jgi:hypothetical protein